MNHTWKSINEEMRRRLSEGILRPGDVLPKEADLAVEFSCTRVTVSRAMRELADRGFIERRRRAGTRVRQFPERTAEFKISRIQCEIEQTGAAYSYELRQRELKEAPARIRSFMALGPDDRTLWLESAHFADSKVSVLERRWINLTTVPTAENADFSQISANEWLIVNVPFDTGELRCFAENLCRDEADIFGETEGKSALLCNRITWSKQQSVTWVNLLYAPGHCFKTQI